MKKVAVLRCLKTSASCAATGCFKAFNNKANAFERYQGEDVQMIAMWTCNGCGDSMLENQEGIQKKIERMKLAELDVLHLSACTSKKNEAGEKVKCPTIAKIAAELAAAGIEIVDGTHH
ncbi:MAG: CGGC domain-containing protein [Phascolarctobacterium sp.]|nr:CGGC domain-containing protein [Phascolarctobacterium sp.]